MGSKFKNRKGASEFIFTSGKIIIGLALAIIIAGLIIYIFTRASHGIGQLGCNWMSKLLSLFANMFGGEDIMVC